MQGLSYTIGVDGSRGINELNKFDNKVTDTGKLVESVFGRKLKQVIEIAAIEEATRRTAEWALGIEQTAKHLGTTAEQLQTLQHIASATGTSADAVTGLFDNIQKGAQEAVNGNTMLQKSFQMLGVSFDDLKSKTTTQIFSQVMSGMSGMGDKQHPGDIRYSDKTTRAFVDQLTGTDENTLQSISAGYNATPGGSFDEKSTKLKENSSIASNEDVQQLSQVWSEVLTSLKEAGTQLLPVATFLVSIVKMLVDAFGGLTEFIGGAFDSVKGLLTGDMDKALNGFRKFGGIFVSFAEGLITALPQLLLSIASKLPKWLGGGIAKAANEMIDRGWNGVGLSAYQSILLRSISIIIRAQPRGTHGG